MQIIDNTATFVAEDVYTELLLGCGHSREKKVKLNDDSKEFKHLITLDINESTNPDVVHDLSVYPWPFQDESFDEIHAYEILEHLGSQGDYKSFFQTFNEIYRILKPKGRLYGSTPQWHGMWAWSDPGHTRIISEGSLMFLSKSSYGKEGSPMTDYLGMGLVKCDFEPEGLKEIEDSLCFILRKV